MGPVSWSAQQIKYAEQKPSNKNKMKKVLRTTWIPSMGIIFPLTPSLSGSNLSYMMSPVNTVSCREKNKKLLEEVENAQLAAHRFVLFVWPVFVLFLFVKTFWQNHYRKEERKMDTLFFFDSYRNAKSGLNSKENFSFIFLIIE